MSLTTAQLATLKAAILATPSWAAQPNTNAGNSVISDAMNAMAVPAFVVWRTNVGISETGRQYVGSEWAGMTSANHTRLQTVSQWLPDGYNAAMADIRAMFDDIWSGAGGAQTRARLLALWKRQARVVEKLLATGTGTDLVPATMGYEGTVTPDEIEQARNS